MNTNSKISTLLKELRKERAAAAKRNDAKAVRKIDFIGKSINALIAKSEKPAESAGFSELPTLNALYDALEKHDWFYEMSDDHRVWKRGKVAQDNLIAMARDIPGGRELYKAFSTHIFSGEPWNTEKQPKPARPTNRNAAEELAA